MKHGVLKEAPVRVLPDELAVEKSWMEGVRVVDKHTHTHTP